MWFLHIYTYFLFLFITTFISNLVCMEEAQGKGNNGFKLSPWVLDTYVLLNNPIFKTLI